jgi:hypothetical protein
MGLLHFYYLSRFLNPTTIIVTPNSKLSEKLEEFSGEEFSAQPEKKS